MAHLPAAAIHAITLPPGVRIHRMSTDGASVAFDEVGYGGDAGQGRTIWLADLVAGTVHAIARTAGDAAWTPTVSGPRVAWTEWRYLDAAAAAGPIAWRVVVLDRADGRTVEEARGVNARAEGAGAIPPLVALDGNHLVHTVESPTAAAPTALTIVVSSLATGEVVARIPTEHSIYQMAAGDGSVAYTEGRVDPTGGFKYATRLMLWRGGGAATLVALDAFELALGGRTLAWISDPASSQSQVGLASHPRAWAMRLDGGDPVAVSAAPDGVVELGASWPSAASGFAAWSDMQVVSAARPYPNDLALWSASLGRTYEVYPTPWTVLTGLGSGRLVWYDEEDSAHPRISWAELSAVDWPAR